jgi:hypothetical protein
VLNAWQVVSLALAPLRVLTSTISNSKRAKNCIVQPNNHRQADNKPYLHSRGMPYSPQALANANRTFRKALEEQFDTHIDHEPPKRSISVSRS